MKIQESVAQLRRVNEPVPTPARLPTEAEVAAAEQRLGVRFHPDYRYFLLHGSDVTYGALEPAVVTPDAGYLDLLQVAADAWKLGVPKEWLSFCESNGDYYCLRADGRVSYWSQDGATDETWPDLAHWIRQVWMEEEEDDEDEY
jgi:SMI1-KNR4 cell-wall